MTGRPPRDVREDAKHVLANALRREGHRSPDVYALELLVVLDGAHIGLTDTTPPADPNADPWARPIGTGQAPDELPEDHPYRIFKAAREAERNDEP
jgi:hypothetical protein